MHPPAPTIEPSPAVAAAQETLPPPRPSRLRARVSALDRLIALFPPGQLLRYLAVGLWNTLFGFSTYALCVSLLSNALPPRLLAVNAPLASVLSTPVNITVAFLGYKFFVFKTPGNYLPEWLRCFAVYGTGMLPSLIALSGLTRFLQLLLTHHAIAGKNTAAYLAGAILTCLTTVFTFLGHKFFSFKPHQSTPPTEKPKLSS